MQMKQFSLFLYEKSPISSPSLSLSPNGLDKTQYLQGLFLTDHSPKIHANKSPIDLTREFTCLSLHQKSSVMTSYDPLNPQ